MERIQLKILGISSGNVASSYTLILEEINGDRKLPIVIGVTDVTINISMIPTASPFFISIVSSPKKVILSIRFYNI